jgi:hypothetical protein
MNVLDYLRVFCAFLYQSRCDHTTLDPRGRFTVGVADLHRVWVSKWADDCGVTTSDTLGRTCASFQRNGHFVLRCRGGRSGSRHFGRRL